MRVGRIILIAVPVVLALAVAGAFAAGLRLVPLEVRSFDEDVARAEAMHFEAEIFRDEWGVPRVLGATDGDAAFALAFAHAEDDFPTIQYALRAALGPEMLAADESEARGAYLVQALGVTALVAAEYETQLTLDTRALLSGYAAGLNYYAALHPDERVRDLFPVTGRDVAALAAFYFPLFYGMSDVLTDLFAPDVERDGARGQELQVHFIAPGEQYELGSNAIAVAPSRSDDGATRVVINSHQPVEGPVAWYETHMMSDEGLNFAGGTFPGVPVLHLGANPGMAHAATINRPDLIDVYELTLGPDDRSYLLDGEYVPFERSTARMLVHLWGPFAFQVTRPIERSVHGTVLRTERGVFAIRHATQGDLRGVEQTYRLMQAQTLAEYEEVMEMLAMGNTNRVVGDSAGRIARYYNARMPLRLDEPGLDWRSILPGERSDLVWNEFAPFSALPHMVDPAAGYVVDANHTPFRVTLGDEDPQEGDFPRTFGIETHMTNRGLVATTALAALETISRDALLAIKWDHSFHEDSQAMQLRAELLAMDWSDEPLMADALAIIEAWDGRADFDNRNAALSLLTYQPVGTARAAGRTGPPLDEAFRDAVVYLAEHHGRLDPPWREVNFIRRGDVAVPLQGGPDTLRAVYGQRNGDGTLSMVAGDGLVMLAEWDSEGEFSLWAVHHFGSSNRPDDPHYTSQMQDFADEVMRRVPMTVDAVRESAVEAYRPGERAAQ
ncbi:penicillin acylase family protein [Glycocaulis sp.]|uniref:penicillin acylase family protein n=1 Tax=Glycocaulis sp. TaxID=1969725 RepID=UPI003F71AD4B